MTVNTATGFKTKIEYPPLWTMFCEILWKIGIFITVFQLDLFGVLSIDNSNILLVNRGLLPTVEANFSVLYRGNVSLSKIDQYKYSYNISDAGRTAVRIFTASDDSQVELPTIFVVRQERSVLSWQIPLLLRYTYEYNDVSRTLCPLDSNIIHPIHHDQNIFIEVSTQSAVSVPYTLKADILKDFLIKTSEKKFLTSSPSNPVYHLYTFPKNVETVLVSVHSDSKLCAVLSIQDTKCPVFDLDKDVDFQGQYQTVTTQGAITVDKSSDSDSFYVVLVVKPNDDDCTTKEFNTISPATGIRIREKNFTLHIEETLPSTQYYKAIIAAIGLFLAFYVVAVILGIYYHGCKANWGLVDYSGFQRGISVEVNITPTERPLLNTAREGYGSIPGQNDFIDSLDANTVSPRSNGVSSQDETQSIDSLNSDEYDKVIDADHDKDILRTKTAIFVSDLARKSEKRTQKNYRLYFKNLITIAIFYGLPVIQLVMTYQKVLNFTGNQDICYYNFMCSHRLGVVSAFNNVFSNIGYVLLGILFLLLVYRRLGVVSAFNNVFSNIGYVLLGILFLLFIFFLLVYRREVLHNRVKQMSAGRHKLFGIPQHFGLYYAMGLALCVEGVMSACYHICPTVTNFQFDTSFMYIIACLCILKIYQNRHPDISAKAHSAYLIMAVIIIVAVCGVVYGTNIFWILFALVYMTASLLLSVHLYYMGRWKLDRYIFKRMYVLIRTDFCSCSRPMYINRLILLAIGNAVNWALAIIGILKSRKSDFASFLLGIFIGNLLLYTIFYLFSKIFSREKIPKLTIALIILSSVTWAFSLYFFFAHLTSWQVSPAESRERNGECIVLQFYDKHDVWHFLSAISLFFSFLIIFTLDDEIMITRRDKISVF